MLHARYPISVSPRSPFQQHVQERFNDRRKPGRSKQCHWQVSLLSFFGNINRLLLILSFVGHSTSLFDMTFETNPPDRIGIADYSLVMNVMPLEVVYCQSILESIRMFFFPGFPHPLFIYARCFSILDVVSFFGNASKRALEDLETAAWEQYECFKNNATLRLQYELMRRKSFHLDITINVCYLLITFGSPLRIIMLIFSRVGTPDTYS